MDCKSQYYQNHDYNKEKKEMIPTCSLRAEYPTSNGYSSDGRFGGDGGTCVEGSGGGHNAGDGYIAGSGHTAGGEFIHVDNNQVISIETVSLMKMIVEVYYHLLMQVVLDHMMKYCVIMRYQQVSH